MKHIFLTSVFLVTVLSTVCSNKNVSIQLQHSNLTANETGAANKTKREKYNGYVNAEVQEIWEQYLAEVGITEFKPFQEIKTKWTADMGKDTVVTEMRRQGRKYTQGIDPVMGGIDQNLENRYHKLKFESFRQPYWADGDYVFLRTGTPTTEPSDKKKVTNPMEAFRACDRTCNLYFKQYGIVCGHRYHMKFWKNEYKDFNNICDIDHENCINPNSNWHPMYRGNCTELLPFPHMEYHEMGIVARGKKWAHYVYVRPKRTEPTTDSVDKELEELQKQQG